MSRRGQRNNKNSSGGSSRKTNSFIAAPEFQNGPKKFINSRKEAKDFESQWTLFQQEMQKRWNQAQSDSEIAKYTADPSQVRLAQTCNFFEEVKKLT